MDDLLREFLTETSESLDTVDNQLVRFEQEPNNAKILDNIFRLVHTIKGTCGFLGLPRLEALAHAAETLMGKFRDGMPVTGQAVTLILTTIDRIKEILGQLEATEAEPEGTDQDLIVELEAMVERGMAGDGGRRSGTGRSRAAAGTDRAPRRPRRRRARCWRRRWSGRCVPAKCRWTNWSAPSARPRSSKAQGTWCRRHWSGRCVPVKYRWTSWSGFRETRPRPPAARGVAASAQPLRRLPRSPPPPEPKRQSPWSSLCQQVFRRQRGRRDRSSRGRQGRQPVDPGQRRYARTPDDHGLGAGA